jgi:outer membrane protein assembly factor BamE (lipoprotein component of BamABCDE complex)
MPTSAGRSIDSTFVQSIQRGRTTADEVRKALGEPASITTSPDGFVWSYTHWEGKPAVFGATYSSSSTTQLVVQFKNGKVVDYQYSTSKAQQAK